METTTRDVSKVNDNTLILWAAESGLDADTRSALAVRIGERVTVWLARRDCRTAILSKIQREHAREMVRDLKAALKRVS
jgi:hypothetical protein